MTSVQMPEGSPEAEGLSSGGLQNIDAMLLDVIAQKVLPGAVTLVARHGKIVHQSVLGLKDISSGAPLSIDTIFRIFSMTKPITAVAMMVLYDRGLWSPDDPIAKHLPEFADVKGPDAEALHHPPTMRELMTHTAGFAYGTGMGANDATDQAYIAAGIWEADNLADFSRRVAAIPLAYQPGERWRYSLSMDLQGAVIERLSGQTLPNFMQEAVFEPLGMVDTGFVLTEAQAARLATPYHMYFVTELTVLEHPRFTPDPLSVPPVPAGGGGLYSTTRDYARFAQMLLNKGELGGVRIIEPSSAALMMSNQLSDRLIDTGFIAGMQKIGPGRGYGYNGAVVFDPKADGASVGRGAYQWDGAGGTWFWIDPENQLLYIGMVQRMMQEGMPRLQALTQTMIAEAIL